MNAVIALLPYVAVCVLIGYFGKEKRIGFWGNFLISLFLSPLVGLIVLFVQEKPAEKKPAQAAAT